MKHFIKNKRERLLKTTPALLLVLVFVLAPVSTDFKTRIELAHTEAWLGAGDPATMWLAIKDDILDQITYEQIINRVLEEIIKATTDWVRSGFHGDPAFVTDIDGFLLEVADRAVGEFIYDSDTLSGLCEPFNLQIKGALSIQYGSTGRYYQPTCTLSGVVDNIDDFIDGDFYAGGLDGFANMALNENNNIYGQTFQAQGELALRVQNARGRELAYLDFGAGFFGVEECDVIDDSVTPERREGCRRVTPGETVNESLNDALEIGNARLELADEFNELYGALLSQLVSQVLENDGGLANFKAQKTYEGDPPTPEEARALVESAEAAIDRQIREYDPPLNNQGEIVFSGTCPLNHQSETLCVSWCLNNWISDGVPASEEIYVDSNQSGGSWGCEIRTLPEPEDNDTGGTGSNPGGPGDNDGPSCFDGIQNQDETGVDTGGVCKDVEPPPDLNAEAGFCGGIIVQWGGRTYPGATLYELRDFSEIVLPGSFTTYYQHSGLEPGSRHSYTVRVLPGGFYFPSGTDWSNTDTANAPRECTQEEINECIAECQDQGLGVCESRCTVLTTDL